MSDTDRKKTQRQATARSHTSELLGMLRGRPQPPATRTTTTDPPRPKAPTPGSATPPPPPPPPSRKRSPLNPPMLQAVGSRLHDAKGQLASLMARANQLVFINRAFHAYLPTHCRPHASIVNLDPAGWIIHTDSPAWATRLRYTLPALRRQLSDHLRTEVPELKVRVRPAAAAVPCQPPRRPTLSSDSAHLLEGTAQSLADRRLSNALLRLAERAREDGKD